MPVVETVWYTIRARRHSPVSCELSALWQNRAHSVVYQYTLFMDRTAPPSVRDTWRHVTYPSEVHYVATSAIEGAIRDAKKRWSQR